MGNDLMTVREAAPRIKCSPATLRRLIHTNAIGYKKIRKRFLFTMEHLQDYLNSVEVSPNMEANTAQGGN